MVMTKPKSQQLPHKPEITKPGDRRKTVPWDGGENTLTRQEYLDAREAEANGPVPIRPGRRAYRPPSR